MFKVSVHIIEPGFFRTNIVNTDNNAKMIRNLYDHCPNEVQEEYGEQYVLTGKHIVE